MGSRVKKCRMAGCEGAAMSTASRSKLYSDRLIGILKLVVNKQRGAYLRRIYVLALVLQFLDFVTRNGEFSFVLSPSLDKKGLSNGIDEG